MIIARAPSRRVKPMARPKDFSLACHGVGVFRETFEDRLRQGVMSDDMTKHNSF